MKLPSVSIRVKLVFSLMLVFAVLAFVAIYIQTQTLEENAEIANRGRDISTVQLIKLYIELSFPGGWQSREGFLYKGPHRLNDGSAFRYLLSDYMHPDTTIRFKTGAPPAENKLSPSVPRIFERPKPSISTETSQKVGMHHLDLPFFTANGVGITVRGEDSSIVGWIYVESGQDRETRLLNSSRHFFFFGAAGLYLAVIAFFGALVLRLTRPVGRIARAHERVKAKNAELANQSWTDHLTGLLNRRGIDDIFRAVEGEENSPTHVAIIDVDHFKEVNDEHGHVEGDRVLTAVAKIISSSIRQGDLCGRWGGEEFIIVFRGLSDAGASAERIRSTVEAHPFGSEEAPLRVTITIGVASFNGRSLDETISAADDAMYIGKREGRNRVVVAKE